MLIYKQIIFWLFHLILIVIIIRQLLLHFTKLQYRVPNKNKKWFYKMHIRGFWDVGHHYKYTLYLFFNFVYFKSKTKIVKTKQP